MKLKSQAVVVGVLLGSMAISYLSSTLLIRWFPESSALSLWTINLTVFSLALGIIIGLLGLMVQVYPTRKLNFREWMREEALKAANSEGEIYKHLILGLATLFLVIGSYYVVEHVSTVLVPMSADPSIIHQVLGLNLYPFMIIYLLIGANTLLPFVATFWVEDR